MNKLIINKGITLIALVITIIVLLILAAVTLNIVLGENGILGKARTSKNSYEYSSAKETLSLKLFEIQSDCIEKNQDYTLEIIADKLGKTTEETIEIMYYYGSTAKVNTNVTMPNSTNISGIVVIVNPYTQYKFLIGEKQDESIGIVGVSTTTSTTPTITEFEEVNIFEKEELGQSNIEQNQETEVSLNEYLTQEEENEVGSLSGENCFNYSATSGYAGKLHHFATDGNENTYIHCPNSEEGAYVEYNIPYSNIYTRELTIKAFTSSGAYCYYWVNGYKQDGTNVELGTYYGGNATIEIPVEIVKIRITMQLSIYMSEIDVSRKLISKMESPSDEQLSNLILSGFNSDEDFSNNEGSYKKYYMFDENKSTFFASDHPTFSNENFGIGWDFKRQIKLSKIKGKIRTKKYWIQYSNDNITWTSIKEKTMACNGGGDEFEEVIKENSPHRYWRILINGEQAGANWGTIFYELQFYTEE